MSNTAEKICVLLTGIHRKASKRRALSEQDCWKDPNRRLNTTAATISPCLSTVQQDLKSIHSSLSVSNLLLLFELVQSRVSFSRYSHSSDYSLTDKGDMNGY